MRKRSMVQTQAAADKMASTDTEVTEGEGAGGKCRVNLGVRS